MDIITISKLRINDAASIEGINALVEKTGKKPYEIIREIIHDYFTKETTKEVKSTSTTLDEDVTESIKKTEVGMRILLKKLFDLSDDEFKELLAKATRKDA